MHEWEDDYWYPDEALQVWIDRIAKPTEDWFGVNLSPDGTPMYRSALTAAEVVASVPRQFVGTGGKSVVIEASDGDVAVVFEDWLEGCIPKGLHHAALERGYLDYYDRPDEGAAYCTPRAEGIFDRADAKLGPGWEPVLEQVFDGRATRFAWVKRRRRTAGAAPEVVHDPDECKVYSLSDDDTYIDVIYGPALEVADTILRHHEIGATGIEDLIDEFEAEGVDPLVGWITGMMVDPSRRGSGVGSAMLSAALAELEGLGVSAVWVLAGAEPGQQDRLREFYGRHGFVLVEDGGWLAPDLMIRPASRTVQGPIPFLPVAVRNVPVEEVRELLDDSFFDEGHAGWDLPAHLQEDLLDRHWVEGEVLIEALVPADKFGELLEWLEAEEEEWGGFESYDNPVVVGPEWAMPWATVATPGYVIIDGWHRVASAVRRGQNQIRAIVGSADPDTEENMG